MKALSFSIRSTTRKLSILAAIQIFYKIKSKDKKGKKIQIRQLKIMLFFTQKFRSLLKKNNSTIEFEVV